MTPRAVALIPARGGSLRVPGKNVRPLAGRPLVAWSVAAAVESGVFEAVVVSTDSEAIAEAARAAGAEVPGLRPAVLATSTAMDVDWVVHVLGVLAAARREFDVFSILRPTSPFRTADTIRRAYERFLGGAVDSLRAVEPCRQHPGKMWLIEEGGKRMRPLLDQDPARPLHSRQYQDLPRVYVQNSSLEIAWTRVARAPVPTIAGDVVMPFVTEGDEGFTIDYEDDWERAERLASTVLG